MRAIDICAGAGGLSLGLMAAGFDVLGVEHDEVAATWHRENVGPCEHASVIGWHPPHSADLVAGGVPCQSFSMAGKRAGLDDERGQLFRQLVRIAVEANARAIVLENVGGLVTWGGGAAIRAVVEAFEVAGYRTTWSVLDAADFGVPQRRKRLFVVGLRGAARLQWPDPTHGDWLTARRRWVSVREAFGLRGGYGNGRKPGAAGWAGMRAVDVDEPGYTVSTKNAADLLAPLDRPARTITTSTHDETPDPERPSRRYGPMLREALAAHEALGQGMRPVDIDAPSYTIGTSRSPNPIDVPSVTVTTASNVFCEGNGHGRSKLHAVRLSVDQCAVLQGWRSGLPWPSKKTDAHRLIGNCVPPALGEAVGRSVAAALNAEARAA